MRALLPWATSAFTLTAMWLIGSKRSIGWIVGLASQSVWITFAVVFEAWGLLPLSAALVVIYTRNLVRWRRDERVPADEAVMA